jgi:hypothetical protein
MLGNGLRRKQVIPPVRYFRFEEKTLVKEIPVGVASEQARFVFDAPFKLGIMGILALINGEWFEMEYIGREKNFIPHSGHWKVQRT